MPKREKNPEYRNKFYNKGRQIIQDAKDRPCVDCGIKLPPDVMDLDHVRGEKTFTISRWNSVRKPEGFDTIFDALRAEIAKCDVCCPTCHALRHFRQHEENAAQRS